MHSNLILDVRYLGMYPGNDNNSILLQEYIDELPVGVNIYLYFGPGVWRFSVTLSRAFQIYGAGPLSTIFQSINGINPPFIVTVTNVWAYHSGFFNCCFRGLSTNVNNVSATGRGYGVALGSTNPLATNINLSYVGGILFEQVYFTFLSHAVYMPHGNIAVTFNHCGFVGNGYGTYNLPWMQATNSSEAMQPGLKTYFDCRFGYNLCGIYSNNCTGEHILNGGNRIQQCHFEQNGLGFYIKDNAVSAITSWVIEGCGWPEGNANLRQPPITSVVVDEWTRNGNSWTRTDKTIDAHYAIIDAPRTSFVNTKFADVVLEGTNNQLVVMNCQISVDPQRNGGPVIVKDPSSRVRFSDCQEVGGFPADPYAVATGYITHTSNLDGREPSYQNSRSFYRTQIKGKSSLSYQARIETYRSVVQSGTLVNDGVLFDVCNQFTITAQSTPQYVFLSNSFDLEIGYWVCTFNYKLVSGKLSQIWLSDGGPWQCGRFFPKTDDIWAQCVIVFHAPVATNSLTLQAVSALNEPAVIKMSALQFVRFARQSDAQDFLNDPVYAAGKGEVVNGTNTFAVGDILAKRSSGYIKSSLQNRNDWGVYPVVQRTPQYFRVATEPGLYSVPGHGWGNTGDLLFHSQTGSTVTSTPPATSEWNHCVGRVFDANTIEIVLPGTIVRL